MRRRERGSRLASEARELGQAAAGQAPRARGLANDRNAYGRRRVRRLDEREEALSSLDLVERGEEAEDDQRADLVELPIGPLRADRHGAERAGGIGGDLVELIESGRDAGRQQAIDV